MTDTAAQIRRHTGTTTTVHLVRHGEVWNPDGILYGRAPGYRLSDRGVAMARAVADHLSGRDVTVLVSSPLVRARETAAPIAAATGLTPRLDARVIEAANHFEGTRFTLSRLASPATWRVLTNPARPSWGEPYRQIATRMLAAIAQARAEARGHEAVIVAHQLPIWTVRAHLEGRSYLHDPRRRECALASVTSLVFTGDVLERIDYATPAAHLITPDRSPAQAQDPGTVLPPIEGPWQ